MKSALITLLIGVLFLTACSQAVASEPAAILVSATETSTPPSFTSTPLPTRTLRERANEPTLTPHPPTPLPTIPTFTATFDISKIVTVTLSSKAECPTEDPAIRAPFATPNRDGSYEHYRVSDILDYLNSGGTSAQLRASGIAEIIDLTNDGVNEVVYRGLLRVSVSILGCKDGEYQDFLDFGGDSWVNLIKAPDLNKNGMSEVILFNTIHYGYVDMSIFEWDGTKFRSLIDMGSDNPSDPPIDWVSFNEGYQVTDTNGDGLKEIVVVYNVHQQARGGFGGYDIAIRRPLRNQTIIIGWNGLNFVNIKQGTNEPPQYRFQAVQDGDEQMRYGNYKAALAFYQAAIFDSHLEWWSPERREYELLVLRSQYELTPTAYPTTIPDDTEYPRLAAYAYYRIMLLHFLQGHESDAGTVYKTLEQKFSNSQYGRPYFEMATAFWDTYQSTRKMYDGCAAAIHYAAEHPEILTPLGSDYHGGYSHTYLPTDVCPFR